MSDNGELHKVRYDQFFKLCEQNRQLLADIYVSVPVRPADGLNVQLHNMLAVWYGEGLAHGPFQDHMGGFIECTRAKIAYEFVKHQEQKFLLMIDNDMEPMLELPLLLARHDQPIVGGCACSLHDEYGPQLCFTRQDAKGNWRFPCAGSGQSIPWRGLVEVGHVGTGAMMIRRDVLESFRFDVWCERCEYVFPETQLSERQVFICPNCKSGEHVLEDVPFMVPQSVRLTGMREGRLNVGEDISFCNQVRKKGFKVLVDLEAHLGHRKMIALSWDEYRRDAAMKAEDWVLPEIGKIIHSY